MKIQNLIDKVTEEVTLWDMTSYDLVIKDSNNKRFEIIKIKPDTDKKTVVITIK
jgi:hypothetical protein